MFGLALHHVGIACADIEKTAAYLKRAFAVISDTGTIFDPVQNAYVRLFNEGQPGAIELVSGASVAKVLKRKTSYYHLCYQTPDMSETLARAKDTGAILVSGPDEAVLFGMRKVAFVFTPLGLVEFLEAR